MRNAFTGLLANSNVRFTIERLTVKVMITVGNAVLNVMRFLLFRRTDNHPKCIIVFRAGALGDFIVALPALRLLRKQYPGTKIVLITVPSLHPRCKNKDVVSGGLILGQDIVDEVLFIPVLSREYWSLLKCVRHHILKLNPDMCVVLPFVGESLLGRIAKILLLRSLGCRNNLYGYHTRSNLSWFRRIQHELNMFEHQVEAPLMALKELKIDCHEVVFEINVPVSDMEVVDTWWLQHGLNDSRLCIAVSPFAKQKHKCWPIGNFKKLGKCLLSRFPGVHLVIVGGPEDEVLGNLLVTAWGGESVNFAGKASILQSAEIIRRCKLFIGNDSGPSHLAAAVGTPVVTIFSSFVYPELWRPWGRKSQIIRRSVPCEFCFTENGKCPKYTNLCLNEISVEEVLSVCLETLDDQVSADVLTSAGNVQYAGHV